MPVGGMHINPFPSVGGARAVSQYACRPRPNFSQLGMPWAILTTCFWLLSFSHLHFGCWSLLLAPGHLLCPFCCFVFSSYLAMWMLWPFFTSGEVAHGLIQLSFGYLQGGDFAACQGSQHHVFCSVPLLLFCIPLLGLFR